MTLANLFCHAVTIRLGLPNPSSRNLEKILYLIENNYIHSDNPIEIVGIYHESQKQSIKSTNQFIEKHGLTNISIAIIKNSIPSDSLYVSNQCTSEFEELFLQTDGLIFLGGADISPDLYGENTFLTTELIPDERNWEISFLFHLLGGNQNDAFAPLLGQKPDYLILGICLGMQEMNVATGGTLYQDIPFQIYKKKDYESILEQNSEKQHKNYRSKINRFKDKDAVLHFHHIEIAPGSLLDFKQIKIPLVTSVHHQSVRKTGRDFKAIATSMDHKVIEAIAHTKYNNVYGIQFHTEFSILYEQKEFLNSRNETVPFKENDLSFHNYFWKDFSDRLKSGCHSSRKVFAQSTRNNQETTTTIKPERLSPGDKIGLVAPAFLISPNDLDTSINGIKKLGFEPVYSDQILGRQGYFSGTDQERADDFNNMIENPEIKAVIFANGGYGCTRILDRVNYDAIKKNPKIIMGFSDCTALINAIHKNTGLITFHGPVSRTLHQEYSRRQFENVAVNPTDRYVIDSSDKDLQKSDQNKIFERYTLTPGKAHGELAGGNLTLICSLMGTPYQIDLKGKIVVIEDIGEEPYRIDRMLTQLIASGELSKASGIAFGICKGCDDSSIAPNSFTLRQVIEERIKPLNIPAVYGLSLGHNENNFTLPIGLKAELDADNKTITLIEKPVK